MRRRVRRSAQPLGVSITVMHRISRLAADRPLILFFALAYGLAWLAWLPLVLSQSGIGVLPIKLPLWTTLPGSYAPLAAACIVRWASNRDLRIGRLLPSPSRALFALILGWLLIAFAFVFLPSVWLTGGALGTFHWAALAVYFHSTPRALLMAGPIGEEPGWRGFALPSLQSHFGPLPGILLLGALWALWHAPLFLVPSWNGASPHVYFLLVAAFSFIVGLCFNLSKGSVLVAVLLHAMFNASSPVLEEFLEHATISANIRPDLILAFSFALVACALALFTGGRLGFSRERMHHDA
jgi:membrane protease YdiL (CAAX protease family)